MALGHYVAGTAFAAAALQPYAQFELDLIKTHASAGMAGDFTVGNSAANADNHGRVALGPAFEKMC